MARDQTASRVSMSYTNCEKYRPFWDMELSWTRGLRLITVQASPGTVAWGPSRSWYTPQIWSVILGLLLRSPFLGYKNISY